MSTAYAQHFSTRKTSQQEPIPGKAMIPNSEGGFVFEVTDWTRLDRFLILGAANGSFYASEKKLTVENAECVLRCLELDGVRAVQRITEISEGGRAPKNDPAIFALAMACSFGIDFPAGDKANKATLTRSWAVAAIPKVCRIGTHIFQFCEYVQAFRGWGRGLRRGIANWYTSKTENDLAYQLCKYQQRNGWSHKDLLRLAGEYVQSNTALLRWAVGAHYTERDVKRYQTLPGGKRELLRSDHYDAVDFTLPAPVLGMLEAQTATDKVEVCRIIRQYNLVRECIPTTFLKEPEVWEALLDKMPMTAMLRNLATMTRIGLLSPLSNAVGKVLAELTNVERIRQSRLHPITILTALKTYAAGRGMKSIQRWTPVPQIVDALDDAFYLAFGNVEPTGKRWLLGIDVSGSMMAPVAGTPLSCCEGATALALVTAHIEPQYAICAFNDGLQQLPISKKTRLDDALKHTRNINGGGTDCSLPMIAAMEHKIPVDVFVVLTDNETHHGMIHPTQALRAYRERMGIAAKSVVAGMTANEFSIADPSDAGQMDCVGWNSSIPQLIADFARGF